MLRPATFPSVSAARGARPGAAWLLIAFALALPPGARGQALPARAQVAPAAGPPLADESTEAALLLPCDWPFFGARCAELASLSLQGAVFSERFFGQSVGGAPGGNETVSGTPSAPLSLANAAPSEGVSEYLGAIAGLGGGGNCAASSLGEGLVSALFATPKRLVRATPQFLDGGTGTVLAWSASGQLLASATGSAPLVLQAPPSGPPIAGATFVSNDAGGLGWTLYAEPWNLITGIAPQSSVNAAAHNTASYGAGVFLRRGQPEGALVTLGFDAPFDPSLVTARFVLGHDFDGVATEIPLQAVAGVPSVGAFQSALVSLAPDGLSGTWRLTIPVGAGVGCYSLRAELWLDACGGGAPYATRTFEAPLVVLFNPWQTSDETSLPSAADRQEYLLETTTLRPRGDGLLVVAQPWRLAQFAPATVNAALDALVPLGAAQRGQPALVARRLSAAVNAEDGGWAQSDLVGPWASGDTPWAWSGSDQLLAAGPGAGPVHDDALAGLLVSFGRALGLPSRLTSCYESARDLDGNGRFDLVLAQDGTVDLAASPDRHADVQSWADMRFRRTDLVGQNGWQAVSATPLALSGGTWQLGPAPLTALFGNLTTLPYDTALFKLATDADFRLSRKDVAGVAQPVLHSTTLLGVPIVTKTVGAQTTASVSAQYKPGLLPPPADGGDDDLPVSGIVVDFHPAVRVAAGQTIDFSARLSNGTSTPWTVRGVMQAWAVAADGRLLGPLKESNSTFTLPAFTQLFVATPLTPADYAPWTARTRAFRVTVAIDVLGTTDTFAGWGRTWVTPPVGTIVNGGGGALGIGLPTTLQAGFVNPLPMPLTNVRAAAAVGANLSLGGGGSSVIALPDVAPGAAASVPITVTGVSAGSELVSVEFSSDQLAGIVSFLQVSVPGTWANLGFALPGSAGAANLSGTGTLLAGSAGSVNLANALPGAQVFTFVGGGAAALPFEGGTYVPHPILLTLVGPAPGGTQSWSWTNWPAGLPPGSALVFQAWFADPGGPQGFAASNALRAVTP